MTARPAAALQVQTDRGGSSPPSCSARETALVVINLRLTAAVHQSPEQDAMGRSWYGYDSARTERELWAQNRGVYGFNTTKIEAERFATMSYRGQILLVAAITSWEYFTDPASGVLKKALIGDVLSADDRVHEILTAHTVPSARNPVGYFEDQQWGLSDTDGEYPGLLEAGDGAVSHGQGWQSDPVQRKHVEDAAQDRLMAHYVDRRWQVEDTRFGSSYDAVARRGDEVVYLEAKGTQTDGASVLVSSGEVNHARAHPGQCVMGVLSQINCDASGAIDPTSGVFKIMPFEPDADALLATAYRWALPTQDE